MKSVVFFALLLILVAVLPQRASAGLFGNGKKKKEKKEAAERDVAMGLQGMQQAVNDPAMLAQLMKDMQDPEMMAEAKKVRHLLGATMLLPTHSAVLLTPLFAALRCC